MDATTNQPDSASAPMRPNETSHGESARDSGNADVAVPAVVGAAERDEQPGEGAYLHWAGRKAYRARVPSPRVLEPVDDLSDRADTDPGNLVIEGDNLQAMVSLRGQFSRQVNVVLIDPPYNTGKNDFRYSDRRFHDPDADDSKGDFVRAERWRPEP